MRYRFLALAAVALAAAPAPAQSDAAAVVKKAIDAHGGAKALDQHPAGAYKVKGVMSLAGADHDFTGDIVYQLPDKFRMTLDLDFGGMKLSVVQVVNGKQMKNVENGKPTPLSDAQKAELTQAAKMQEVSQLTPLLDSKKYTLKAEKDAKVGDEEAAVVLVTAPDFKDTRMYFSKKTGLLVKTERKALAPGGGGKEVVEETRMSDFKPVDGVMVPMKLTVNHDGMKFMTMTVAEAKMTDKADPKAFATDD